MEINKKTKIIATLAVTCFLSGFAANSALAAIFPKPCPNSIMPLFSPGSEGELIALARAAQSEISVEIYQFSYVPLMDALAGAASRGVMVRVILDRTIDKNYGTAKYLSQRGVLVRLAPLRFSRMHSKFALYDRKNLVVGSTNWSFHAMFLNREASVVVDDSGVSRAFSEIFEGDWSESAPYLN